MARSADSSSVRWLRGELPGLVEQGVITTETAQALDRYYPPESKSEPSRVGFVISAILGSALLGAGVILLIAHNWDQLGRPLRCAIAFLPLLVSCGLGIFVLQKREGSQAWRESAAIFNIASIGTAISLVSQTYQIQGDFAKFILVWMLLALPVVYLFRTMAGLCAYLVGAMVWILSKGDYWMNHSILWSWVLLGLAVPRLAGLVRRDRNDPQGQAALIVFVLAANFALGSTAAIGIRSFWGCAFAGLWVVVYLIGTDWFARERPSRVHVLEAMAWIAIVSLMITLSFVSIWEPEDRVRVKEVVTLAGVIEVAWVVAACLLLFISFRRRNRERVNFVPALFVAVTLIGWFVFRSSSSPLVPALLLNAYGLALGVFTLLRGVRAGRVLEANFGMLIIAALAIVRFLDTDFEFLVRGIGFIVIGAGFLITNLIVFKRRATA